MANACGSIKSQIAPDHNLRVRNIVSPVLPVFQDYAAIRPILQALRNMPLPCVVHSFRIGHHPAVLDAYNAVGHLPHLWRVADENHLVEPSDVHGPPQHPHIFFGVLRVQRPHRFIPEERFMVSPLGLPHVVDGDAEIHRFVHQHKLAA